MSPPQFAPPPATAFPNGVFTVPGFPVSGTFPTLEELERPASTPVLTESRGTETDVRYGEGQRTSIAFGRLDPVTREKIEAFQKELATFSEGCSRERDLASASLVESLVKDTQCGVAAAQALQIARSSKSTYVTALATLTATIVCGYEVPTSYRAKKEATRHLKECEDMQRLRDKFKNHCAGKPRIMFAYTDALYCYTADETNDLCLLVIDFKKRTAEFSKTWNAPR
jgi:hypothetical protein